VEEELGQQSSQTPAPVDEADFKRELELVRAGARGAAAGIFGPESVMWRVDREAAIFLGAGRALLLQLAHPWVAAAIAEHSQSLVDPIGRFHRTFNIVFTMVFGSLDQAMAAARRLHCRHAGITGALTEAAGSFAAGTLYWANDVAALRWVHATLIETALVAYELVLPPLAPEDREQYYAEARLFGGLFGIPQSSFPRRWGDFTAYCEAMCVSDTLAVGAAAAKIARELFGGANRWLRVPAWYRALTARMLPVRFRDAYGLAYGAEEQREAERALGWIRRIYPPLPARLRFVGPYQEAQNRLSGRRSDTMTELANRFWIGQGRMTE
jgi:uncharacterized protein (DUF2236 family)